jgi:hypothetical protein
MLALVAYGVMYFNKANQPRIVVIRYSVARGLPTALLKKSLARGPPFNVFAHATSVVNHEDTTRKLFFKPYHSNPDISVRINSTPDILYEPKPSLLYMICNLQSTGLFHFDFATTHTFCKPGEHRGARRPVSRRRRRRDVVV